MDLLSTLLYLVWIALPAFYLIMLCVYVLEHLQGKNFSAKIKDTLNQLVFLIITTILAFMLDIYLFPWVFTGSDSSFMAGLKSISRILLYPFLLYIMAKTIKGSKEIKPPENPRLRRRR